MGCFTVLKHWKQKDDQIFHSVERVNSQEHSTTLPEPKINTRTLQSAPSSFRCRVKPVLANAKALSSRTRTLSAPSSLTVAKEDNFTPTSCEEEDARGHVESKKDLQSPSPQPLPLPAPQSVSTLKNTGSFNTRHTSGPLDCSGPLPLPPTLPLAYVSGSLRNFSYEVIAAACLNFAPQRCMSESLSSVVYRASFGDDTSSLKRTEASVVLFHSTNQGLKEFVSEISTLATLQHPYICMLLGFHAHEASKYRMVVYERLCHGSLDRLLLGRSDVPPIDWNARMKVALCAAQGLTFLHEEGPFQAMFHEFSSANIQIDKDFSSKLSGYGCVDTEISSGISAAPALSTEAQERGLLTPKSDVWSFGIVLLELLTGRKHLDTLQPKEERNLVKWSRPFLSDDCRLSLIMDPQLKGRYPAKAVRIVADIAQKCLQKDPSERPTMRTIVESLKTIQDLKHPSRFPLQEPRVISGKNMSRSPSFNGIVTHAPKLSPSPSPPTRMPSISLTRLVTFPSSLPP